MPKWWQRGHTIAVIVVLSMALHGWAVWQLPVDADEPAYMHAGRMYAERITNGDIQGVIDYAENREHPPLVKLFYSLPYIFGVEGVDGQTAFYINRSISAVFGVLQVLLLALIDPLAGFFLAMHSYTIKYTSQVYLESLPLFSSLITLLAFKKAIKQNGDDIVSNRLPWLWLSAFALGITAASKYTYLMILFPLVFMALYRRVIPWRNLIFYGVVALGVFWLFNPYLWNDPLSRLADSIAFHSRYTQGMDVQRAAYPWYQPLIWIATALPWHPQVFFFLTFDEIIFWSGTIGAFTYARKKPWLTVWFISNLIILLFWTTKWPQYSLIITPALCMLGSGFLRWAYGWIKVKNDYWDYLEEMLPKPPRLFWWLVIGISVAIIFGKVGYEYERALSRRGWTQVVANISPLPSNKVNDIYVRNSGQIILATDHGAALWSPIQNTPWGADNLEFNVNNSQIIDNRVMTVLEDRSSRLWFGTDRGLSVWDEERWVTYRAEDLGLPGERIRSVLEDSQGKIWVGTVDGLSVWDGLAWQSFLPENSGLLDESVFKITLQETERGDVLWFGTRLGIASFTPLLNEWENWNLSTRDLGWGGVSDILVDSKDQVWIATLGGGLAKWEGQDWRSYRSNNSGLPTNFVRKIVEGEDGQYWVGLGFSTEPGGLVARVDAENNWQRYSDSNSGYIGSEPMVMRFDTTGRLWIGTATAGLQIFDLSLSR